jgi:phosphonate transport system substrate-binding protein
LWLLPAALVAATLVTSGPVAAQEGSADPAELVIGFVPSREADALVENIQPLADHLTEVLGIPVEGIVTDSYPALVTAMSTGQAQIGALPPYGLVQAIDEAGANVILQSERFGSATYHSQFFTSAPDKYCADAPVENTRIDSDVEFTLLNCNGTDRAFDESPEGPIGLEAIASITPGTTIAVGQPSSASGYIFPVTALLANGIDPEADVELVPTPGHDAAVIAVCEGQAEVGVSFDDARTDAVTDCDVPGTVVVFAYGPEIPNDGIAVAGGLSADLTARIKQGLLDYAATEEGARVLESIYNITALTEPNIETLGLVRQAVEELGYGE